LMIYLKENPGTPFVLAFMVLLVSAGALLLVDQSVEAYVAGVYAFYSIVLGVVIQVGVIVRDGRKHSQSNDDKQSSTS
jgi:hypothetical protein